MSEIRQIRWQVWPNTNSLAILARVQRRAYLPRWTAKSASHAHCNLIITGQIKVSIPQDMVADCDADVRA